MRRISRLIDNEQGVALVLALMILLTLTGLVLAFLSASAFEPQISRNHSETVRARYVAEAGVEYAYDTLATDVGSWNDHLAGATCAQGAVLGAPNSSLPGLGSAHGTFTVRIRNDCKAGDDQLTGVALDTATGGCDPAAPGTATRDSNCKVIVTSTGTIGTTTRTITVVISKTAGLPINGALAFPGSQADVSLHASSVMIDGRDTKIGDRPGAPTGSASAVYGITVNSSLPALAARLETALADGTRNDVRGKDETNPSDDARRQHHPRRRRPHVAGGHGLRRRRKVDGRPDDQRQSRQRVVAQQYRLDVRDRSRELDVLGHACAPGGRLHPRRATRRPHARHRAQPRPRTVRDRRSH